MEFENYTSTSKCYDSLRRPVGLDSLYQALEMASDGLQKPVNRLKLLDVGCGTGNYLELLMDKVGSCHGLEINSAMLDKAHQKLASRVSLRKGSVMDMS
jgi:ubiquinone/menaquinone biosynthesis C-methylase UbiE